HGRSPSGDARLGCASAKSVLQKGERRRANGEGRGVDWIYPQAMQPDEHWNEHYVDERDAAFLYRELAKVEKDTARRELFERLAVVQDRYRARWEELFAKAGQALPAYRTSLRTRVLAAIARTF